ncbi:protein ANTAGONIST OF LIKE HETEROCHROMATIN PROTEIN 1 [Silene latifolia]|uniref:protein ANTAGONIST OF LIKE HETEROCHROMATIN PROTEIN 1 n=1 Tax=Silene latifolia TaxID=37657 RepID=UPI003D77B4E3
MNNGSSKPNNGVGGRKRRKKDVNAEEKQGFKEIVSSFLLLEDEEKVDKQEWDNIDSEEKSNLDANHKKKTQSMEDYYSNMQNHYEGLEGNDRLRRKKSRVAVNSAVTAVATEMVEKSCNLDVNSSGKQSGSGSLVSHQRRLWVKDRSKAWWDECNSPEFPEAEFRKFFRMGKSTFEVICEELNSVVAKEDTMLRAAIPVKQRVAVCIYRLATGEPLRLVSKRFGLGISTCHKLVLEVCQAIRNVLMPKYLQWPNEESLKRIEEEYESLSGIPNVVGSMYTTHIPIIAPKISVAAYFNKRHTERNQKTSYSITVQGVVNPKGVFTDICIGWPGSMPDDKVLEKSALYQRGNQGLLKGVWIVGGSGYPLMDWVLVPYTQSNLTWTQHAFNEKIGEVQKVAKDAFARLKGRWCCLQKRTEVKLQELPMVLGACCVLHNICEIKGEVMDPEANFDLFDDEMMPDIPLQSMTTIKTRDAIAHNLLHHGLGGTGFL